MSFLSPAVNEVQQLLHNHFWGTLSASAASAYTVLKGGAEALRVGDDLRQRFASNEFEVKTTHYKTVIRAEETDVVKLRTIRFHQKVNQISIDRRPHKDGNELISLVDFYSVPGRAEFGLDENFDINFGEEERPRAHSQSSVVLGFTMRGKPHELYPSSNTGPFKDPGVRPRAPVGSDLLVVEVHFPPEFKLQKSAQGPLVWVHSVSRENNAIQKLTDASRLAFWKRPRKVTTVTGSHDFTRSGTLSDYIRVTITKPPQGVDIHVSWKWEIAAVVGEQRPAAPTATAAAG